MPIKRTLTAIVAGGILGVSVVALFPSSAMPSTVSASDPVVYQTLSPADAEDHQTVLRLRAAVLPTTTTEPPPPPTTTTTTASPPSTPPPPPPPPPPPSSTQAIGDPYNDASWDRLAQCESGGNWSINTGNGYYGGLQFSLSSWRAVGGTGYPHENSREEQITRGRLLWEQGGWAHWPGCTRSFGWR